MSTQNSKKNLRTAIWGIVTLLGVVVTAAIAVWGYAGIARDQGTAMSTTTVEASVSQQAQPPKGLEKEIMVLDLNGKWTGTMKGVQFDVTVDKSTITIRMVSNGSNMLYWYGNFPTTGVAGDTVTSDKLEINKAVMSQAPSKEFVLVGNTMKFEVTAMGNTVTVEVTHV